jgi:hypothetical protein
MLRRTSPITTARQFGIELARKFRRSSPLMMPSVMIPLVRRHAIRGGRGTLTMQQYFTSRKAVSDHFDDHARDR